MYRFLIWSCIVNISDSLCLIQSPSETFPYTIKRNRASLVAQLVKSPPAMQETPVRFLGWEDLLEKGQATHSSILGFPLWLSWWRIRLQCGRPGFSLWVGKISCRRECLPTPVFLGLPYGSAGKESTCNAGDLGSIPGSGRSAGEGIGYPFKYSGLENSTDSVVHGVAKSRTRLSDFHFLFKWKKNHCNYCLYHITLSAMKRCCSLASMYREEKQTRNKVSREISFQVAAMLWPCTLLGDDPKISCLPLQAFWAPAIRRPKATTGSWTRSKPYAGSRRTSGPSVGTPRESPSSARARAPPASASWPCLTIQKVRRASLTLGRGPLGLRAEPPLWTP